MFIGWEGVGLVSYLLINFWYNRFPANRAALKAIIINRIGDFFFILAILLIWACFGNCDFLYLINVTLLDETPTLNIGGFDVNGITAISFFLLLASMVKSAQFGFHTWLPDAMEGPTPVSALLHAATMVTAGVFLVIRSSFFFDKAPVVTTFMLIIGSVTTFFASFVAYFQHDMKKIIAYSTCAQLGLMFVSCALGHYILALFHLFNHAFFKALLFLSAGIIIHGIDDEQDIRHASGLLEKFPIVSYSILIGSLSLMGFPYLTGFYSKEIILNSF
jgi:NADH-quinone oxidoreductase subunit L